MRVEHGEVLKVTEIPQSIRLEHGAIHSVLVEATKATGAVGAAARALAHVLHPHFVREEEIALPPLGLLGPLSRGLLPTGARRRPARQTPNR